MAGPPLLRLDKIALTFGGTPLLQAADLSLSPGDHIALVGRNGSGKSTMLKIAAGLIEPSEGKIFRQPNTTIGYLDQKPEMSNYATVRAYIMAGLQPLDADYRVDYLIEHLSLDGGQPPENLSGGEARRAAIARVIAPQPDILLLDEPTNHLDLTTIEWLEKELVQLRSSFVVISHDRRFLERVSQSTVWLDRGVMKRIERGFAYFEQWRDKILEEEEQEFHKLGQQIEREEHWLRYGVTARRKRNMRRLGRLQELRKSRENYRGPQGTVVLNSAQSQDSAKLIIEAKDVSKSFGDKALIKNFSLRVQRGDRLGLIGPNGIGKTTLLKILTGDLAPDSGTVRLGQKIEKATLDQLRSLNPNETLAHYLTDGRGESVVINGEVRHVVSYMKDFLFQPEQARTPIKELSGGERARLMLARLLSRSANLLILDEPTNDLDMETLDLLQELVANFDGTVILVSHDRDFLDRTVTSTIAPEGDGKWLEYAGGYSDMLSQRQDQLFDFKKSTGGKKKVKDFGALQPDKENFPTAENMVSKPKLKLSFKQKYALENLPQEIEVLNATIQRLEAQLANPDFYSEDAILFQKYSKELVESQQKLAEKEEEWLSLEILREQIEAKPRA